MWGLKPPPRTAGQNSPCTSLQRRIPKGLQDTLGWEPPSSSPTGSTCSNSLTGFQECSLQPVNKGLSKQEMQRVILFANLHPVNTDSQAIGFGFISTQSPSLGVTSLESKFLYNEMDLAAKWSSSWGQRKKPTTTLPTLLSNYCVIYVKLLVARRNRSRFAYICYRKGL